jgi:hypothetical protein
MQNLTLRETFLKNVQGHFLASLNPPIYPDIFIFFETRTQYKVTGKNQKICTLLRALNKGSKKRKKFDKNVNFSYFFMKFSQLM